MCTVQELAARLSSCAGAIVRLPNLPIMPAQQRLVTPRYYLYMLMASTYTCRKASTAAGSLKSRHAGGLEQLSVMACRMQDGGLEQLSADKTRTGQ
jgi:hypothetical protein